MTNYFIADLHLSHNKMYDLPFDNYEQDGPLRPYSQAITEALMLSNCEKLNHQDRLYMLGDIAFRKPALNDFLSKLKCKVILIQGNHDRFSFSYYRGKFSEVYSFLASDEHKIVLSHKPQQGLPEGWLNIHGHMHDVPIFDDKQHFCVSVERINYRPISFVEIKQELKNR